MPREAGGNPSSVTSGPFQNQPENHEYPEPEPQDHIDRIVQADLSRFSSTDSAAAELASSIRYGSRKVRAVVPPGSHLPFARPDIGRPTA